MKLTKSGQPAHVSPELLARLDSYGPRYTSYPTADRFVEAFGPADQRRALGSRAQGAARNAGTSPLSLYVHVPFCESVCYYCACNKVVTRQHQRGTEFLDDIEAEVALYAAELGARQLVTRLHLGGGSPTFLDDTELGRLMAILRTAFSVSPQAELSIEADPRTVDGGRMQHLASLGFSRVSFGVQDFDPAVQAAVHRAQSLESVRDLLFISRELGFKSTNLDLIYGLPRQTPESFARTVRQVSDLRPDRIAMYAYAHLPRRFKPQRRIDPVALPTLIERISMLASAIESWQSAGYCYIGMDHFALPDDPLAAARRQGRLYRDFQGYGTAPDGDLIGLGPSAISRIGATYSQNEKLLPEYHDAVRRGELPTARGIALTRDDLLRRSVIMSIMCQGRVDIEAVSLANIVDFGKTFASEMRWLEPLSTYGLVELTPSSIDVTPLGWYFVRKIAMVFDRHLQANLL